VCSSASTFASDLTDDFATGVDVVLNDDLVALFSRLSIGNKLDCSFSLVVLFSTEFKTREECGVVSMDESLSVFDEPSLVLASSSSPTSD
jgi:hypothetical protein